MYIVYHTFDMLAVLQVYKCVSVMTQETKPNAYVYVYSSVSVQLRMRLLLEPGCDHCKAEG